MCLLTGKQLRNLLAAICALVVSAGSAWAVPVVWTFSGGTFSDGGTISGSFIYDADLGANGTFSSVNVTTTMGTNFIGATYDLIDTSFVGPILFSLLTQGSGNLTGVHDLTFAVPPGMTDAGGALGLTGGSDSVVEGTCLNSVCNVVADARTVTAGTIDGVAESAPEPASMLLAGIGAAAIALRRSVLRSH
jgi:hypothetical protein